MSALTAAEKVKVRHHMGYLNVQDAQTFTLGTPASVETQFIIEGAMNRVLAEALPLLREILSELDRIEQQRRCNRENIQVTQLGEISINSTGPDRELRQLVQEYDYTVDALANILGCVRNPFDKRKGHFGTGGVNVRVG